MRLLPDKINKMEVHKVKSGTKVRILDENVKTPPASLPVNKGDEIIVKHLDGMYCNGTDTNGNTVYIAGWTEVEPI